MNRLTFNGYSLNFFNLRGNQRVNKFAFYGPRTSNNSLELKRLSGKDTHSGRSNDGHSLLVRLLDQLPCEGLRDAFSYDGNGPDLKNSPFLLTLCLR